MRHVWLVLLLALAAVGASAQEGRDRGWGLHAGVFLPSDRTVREIFGDTWASVGIQPISFGNAKRWRLTGGVTVLTASNDGNRLLAIPATVGATMEFDQGNGQVPFVALAGGPTYYDYSIVRLEGGTPERFATRRIGWNANVRAGITFHKRLQVQARYDVYSETDGFRFDGLTLSVAFQVARF